jgi:hypothetical protein
VVIYHSSPRCAVAPLQGKVEKILTWRWKEEDEEKKPSDDDSKQKGVVPTRAEREFFIKWKDQVNFRSLFTLLNQKLAKMIYSLVEAQT